MKKNCGRSGGYVRRCAVSVLLPYPAGWKFNLHNISFPKRPDLIWSLPSLICSGFWGLFPVIKRLEYEAGHWPPYSAKVTSEWSCTFTPSYVFMGCTKTTLRLSYLRWGVNGSYFSGTRTDTHVLLCQSATECAFYGYKFSVVFNIRELLTRITHSFWKELIF